MIRCSTRARDATLDQQRTLGLLGVIRSKGALGFQFRGQAIVAELRVEVLARLAQLIPQMRELSPFPPVTTRYQSGSQRSGALGRC